MVGVIYIGSASGASSDDQYKVVCSWFLSNMQLGVDVWGSFSVSAGCVAMMLLVVLIVLGLLIDTIGSIDFYYSYWMYDH
jgi:hypothetical protein